MDFPWGLRLPGRAAMGFVRPRRPVLGAEFTGRIAATGKRVTRFRMGDEVLGLCGLRMGAHAEYLRVPESGAVIERPSSMPIETAAALSFGGTTALHFLRRAKLQAGENLLVIGASGTVGSALAQLAVAAGARVTAVTSAAHLKSVQQLGVNRCIDYTRESFMDATTRYAIIADAVGVLSFAQAQPLLEDSGRFLAINASLRDMLARPRNGRRCIAGPAAERRDDLHALARSWLDGQYSPLIDRVVAFSALPDAHRRADSGHKCGSVVINLESDHPS